MEKGESSFEARHKEKPTSMLERLDRRGREGPMESRFQNSHQEIGDYKKDAGPGQSRSSPVYCAKLVSTRGAVTKAGPKFLRGPARGTLHSRGTKESGWKAQGKDSAGDRRCAERNPQRAEEGQQTSRGSLIL